ncbi:Uncharacterised protein [Mycobacteroides abscessus subsp. abscessus]|nr:Uncharacterised protein [Mycobacteroides abscessus subsp. abscessus]
MAAAPVPLSEPSSDADIAAAARCGQAIPIPAPVTTKPSAQHPISRTVAPSRCNTPARNSPAATTAGATDTTRETVRAWTDALIISPTVHPNAKVAPRNPAATGLRCPSRCPKKGM